MGLRAQKNKSGTELHAGMVGTILTARRECWANVKDDNNQQKVPKLSLCFFIALGNFTHGEWITSKNHRAISFSFQQMDDQATSGSNPLAVSI